MILVAGATSRVGTRVIPLLLARSYAVRAITRTPEKTEPLKQLGAEVVPGDLRDPPSLARASQSVELLCGSCVFWCAPSIQYSVCKSRAIFSWIPRT